MTWPMPNWPKVLLIDDSPASAEILMRDLRVDEINVITARTLDEGFELALKILPSLILVDYKFDGDTGLDFAQRLRNASQLERIPRILITERPVDQALRIRALQEGYMACLQKPQFDRSWADLIRSFMEKKQL